MAMIDRNVTRNEFSTVKVKNISVDYTHKIISCIFASSFSLAIVIILIIVFAGFQNRADSYDILLSLGFVQLMPEDHYNRDDRTRRNWYYFSNLSLTMKEASKYCFDSFPGMARKELTILCRNIN